MTLPSPLWLDDFFVGIGDINSAYLPAITPPAGSTAPPAPLVTPAAPSVSSISSPQVVPSDAAPALVLPEVQAEAAAALTGSKDVQDAALSRAQSLVIEHVVHDRPLAKMQEKLDLENEPAETALVPTDKAHGEGVDDNKHTEVNGHGENNRTETPHSHKIKHKMLLHNNDSELQRVEQVRSKNSGVAFFGTYRDNLHKGSHGCPSPILCGL